MLEPQAFKVLSSVSRCIQPRLRLKGSCAKKTSNEKQDYTAKHDSMGRAEGEDGVFATLPCFEWPVLVQRKH